MWKNPWISGSWRRRLRKRPAAVWARSSSRSAALLHTKEQLGQLAHLLLDPERGGPEAMDRLIRSLNLPFGPGTCFPTLLVDCLTPLSVLPETAMDELQARFVAHLTAHGLSQLYTFRADRYIIIQLYGDSRPGGTGVESCTRLLAGGFFGICHFFIARGAGGLRSRPGLPVRPEGLGASGAQLFSTRWTRSCLPHTEPQSPRRSRTC